MNEQTVRERVRGVVREMAPLRGAKTTSSSLVIVDLGYDSLGLVELAVALEQEFDLPAATDDDAIDIETVGDIEERVLTILSRQLSKEGNES